MKLPICFCICTFLFLAIYIYLFVSLRKVFPPAGRTLVPSANVSQARASQGQASQGQASRRRASPSLLYKKRSLPLPVVQSHSVLPTHSMSQRVTVVTAYFNLGSFAKGGPSNIYSPSTYIRWMTIFRCIHNPVVAYFESEEMLQYFQTLRSNLSSNLTQTFLVDRNNLWSFSLYTNITAVFAHNGYPRHLPNTVVPEYGSAMHAKYELMQRALLVNPFSTKYFSWLDVGLFRGLVDRNMEEPFSIILPLRFDERKVAYTQVYKPKKSLTRAEQIFHRNEVWVCGCFFLAEHSVMLQWVQEYMQFTHHFLQKGLASTDQQVIYAAFKTLRPNTKIQVYQDRKSSYNVWFYLGYLLRNLIHNSDTN